MANHFEEDINIEEDSTVPDWNEKKDILDYVNVNSIIKDDYPVENLNEEDPAPVPIGIKIFLDLVKNLENLKKNLYFNVEPD